jgi:hypothetical protein
LEGGEMRLGRTGFRPCSSTVVACTKVDRTTGLVLLEDAGVLSNKDSQCIRWYRVLRVRAVTCHLGGVGKANLVPEGALLSPVPFSVSSSAQRR